MITLALHGYTIRLANRCCYASVWCWRRKAAGGWRNGVSEAMRRSGAANARRKRTRLRFSLCLSATSARYTAVNARWSRTLNPKAFAF